MIEYVDIALGISFGDEGKGKVISSLIEKSLQSFEGMHNTYTHCIKTNGGHNSGHSSYFEGKKIITHCIPTGVFWGIKSIIGPGAVLNVPKFFQEIENLEKITGAFIRPLVKIAKNVHIITDNHLIEDKEDTKIGTTKMGTGPCYRDKYSRCGIRAFEISELRPFLIDMYDEFYSFLTSARILIEGSQGYFLDINSENYPYVTSSHCDIGGVLSNGFSWKDIRNVYGIIKSYTTYVGARKFQPEGEIFKQLQQVGKEFGATTGRIRQCNWNHFSLLRKAILLNGITHLIINKMDILKEIDHWALYDIDNQLVEFSNEDQFKIFVEEHVKSWGVKEILFSYSPMVI